MNPEHRSALRNLACTVAIAALAWAPTAAGAGTEPTSCDDLAAIAPTPGVDFASDILPIFAACSGCHGADGAAELDLRSGEAYDNLVGVTATTNPDRLRVEPGAPDRSVLLAAVNCRSPDGPAFQMPGTVPAQRALIRDWIAQGATRGGAPLAVPVLTPAGLALMLALVLLAARRRMRARRS